MLREKAAVGLIENGAGSETCVTYVVLRGGTQFASNLNRNSLLPRLLSASLNSGDQKRVVLHWLRKRERRKLRGWRRKQIMRNHRDRL